MLPSEARLSTGVAHVMSGVKTGYRIAGEMARRLISKSWNATGLQPSAPGAGYVRAAPLLAALLVATAPPAQNAPGSVFHALNRGSEGLRAGATSPAAGWKPVMSADQRRTAGASRQ